MMEVQEELLAECEFKKWPRIHSLSPEGRLVIENYLKAHPERVPEIEIDESEEKNLDKFMELNIPVTKVYINNVESGPGFYKKWSTSIAKFLESYGSKITHLRVFFLRVMPLGLERSFILSLTNLESLHARNWIMPRPTTEEMDEINSAEEQGNSGKHNVAIPYKYNSLKSINIGLEDIWSDEDGCSQLIEPNLRQLFMVLAKDNSTLEYVRLPLTPVNQEFKEARDALDQLSAVSLEGFSEDHFAVASYILHVLLGVLNLSEGHKLKTISFGNCHYFYAKDYQTVEKSRIMEGFQSHSIVTLMEECLQKGVCLEMVNSAWFMDASFYRLRTDFGSVVKSMINIHPNVIELVKMNNLEELYLKSSRSCVNTGLPGAIKDSPRPKWPLLKELHMLIDSAQLGEEVIGWAHPDDGQRISLQFPPAPVSLLFRFLFAADSPFEKLTNLGIWFDEIPAPVRLTNTITWNIAMACANITKLELVNWIGKNKAIIQFFQQMKRLEEVLFDKCKELGNVAFVGEDVNNPVFLGLTNMEKVTLLGLDEMPKLTNTLFGMVLAKVKLTHLNLTSKEPLVTVTVEGIRSLLDGPFAESIVEFPFDDWSLKDCSTEDFAKLLQEFRSSKMF